MIARLRLLIVTVILLLPFLGAGAATTVNDRGAGEGSAIQAAPLTLPLDLLAAERIEIVSGAERELVQGGGTESGHAGRRSSAPMVPLARQRVAWTDLVQCRRLAGARLLRFATPPPFAA